jgi:hypothetical protein
MLLKFGNFDCKKYTILVKVTRTEIMELEAKVKELEK